MAKMTETESSITIKGLETSVVKLTRAEARELDTGSDALDGALDEMQAEAETETSYVVIEISPGEI
jgi:hypothetical protein